MLLSAQLGMLQASGQSCNNTSGTKQNNCLSPQTVRSIAGVGGQRWEWLGIVRIVKNMGVGTGNATKKTVTEKLGITLLGYADITHLGVRPSSKLFQVTTRIGICYYSTTSISFQTMYVVHNKTL